ncbi:MAG TPA: energy transducer TonB [Allosphingosinicella sp.]|jgi:TonB family protein
MNVVLLALSALQASGDAELDRHLRAAEPGPAQYRSGRLAFTDYPTAALRAGHQGSVIIRVRIGTTGRIEGCEIVESSGHEVLDDATCRRVSGRYRYFPAIGDDGRPTVDAIMHRVAWTLPSPMRTVDVALESHLRAGRPGPARLRGAPEAFDYPASALAARAQGTTVIRFVVGETGRVGVCSVARSSGNEDLDTASCLMAINHLLYFPAIGRNGRPETETRTQSINWRLPDAAPAAEPAPPPGDA